MYNRNLLYCSLRSERQIRLPFNFAQGRLKRIHSELLKSSIKAKIKAYKSITDGYTSPLCVI